MGVLIDYVLRRVVAVHHLIKIDIYVPAPVHPHTSLLLILVKSKMFSCLHIATYIENFNFSSIDFPIPFLMSELPRLRYYSVNLTDNAVIISTF